VGADRHVAMVKVSRYPIEALTAFNERMGWTVPYVSSLGSDFNYDFGVAHTEDDFVDGRPGLARRGQPIVLAARSKQSRAT
jgi:predicted dithiol-disulfide oxidoreductase (DUF899 family)